MARAAKPAGRHKKSKSVRRRQRAGVATAAVMTAAMGATVTLGAAPASAVDVLTFRECSAGSGVKTSTVDCKDSIAPPLIGVLSQLGVDLPITSTAAARAPIIIPPLIVLGVEITPEIVVDPGSTAKISGVGVAYANSQLGTGHAEANAWGFVSAAVALNALGGGTATATSLPLGVTIAASDSGTSTAFAIGGIATAIDVIGVAQNVSCLGLVTYASASDIGSCAGLLFLFSVEQAAGSPEYVFAIADPTSLQILSNDGGLIPLPIPQFTRDLIRIGVGGPGGVRIESDLVPPTATSTQVSARVASAPEPSITAVADESEPAAEPEQAYVGKHRAVEPVEPVEPVAEVEEVEEEPAEAIWTAPEDVKDAPPESEPAAGPDATVTAEETDTTPSTPASAEPAAD